MAFIFGVKLFLCEVLRRAKSYVGYLAKSKTEYYTIHPATKIEKNAKTGKTLLGSVGYEIYDQNRGAVAAVSLMNKGMVFLGKTTKEERFLMANAAPAVPCGECPISSFFIKKILFVVHNDNAI